MINNKLILIKKYKNSENNNGKINNNKTNYNKNVRKVKINIVISKSKIFILISF